MAISDHPDFRALDPFFEIVERGVSGLVDGERFFEMLAEDAVFDMPPRVSSLPPAPHAVF
jgi:uncharacterized protein